MRVRLVGALLRLSLSLLLITCSSDQPLAPGRSRVQASSDDVTPPTVQLTAPAEGDTLTAPATILADASDDVLLAGVEFFLGGVSLGPEDDTAPFEALLNTDTLAAGPAVLTAQARDTAGNTTLSATVNVVVFHPDTTPPAVALTAPAHGSTLTAPTAVTADATDDFMLAGVTFRANAVNLGAEDAAAPYEAILNTDTLPDGAYDLVAVARDTAGNITLSQPVTVTVFHPDVTPPTVAITAPADGATITAPTAITADAGDDGPVAGVQFRLNGVDLEPEDLAAPYAAQLNSDTLPAGPYTIIAVARDTAGNTATSAPVQVTVFHPDLSPPTVTITAPADGATITAPAVVTADASDDGPVAGVTFRANGVDLGPEDTFAPYSALFNTDTLAAGSYVLVAVARDTAGNLGSSAPVTVTVFHADVTPPTVAITAPADGAVLSAPVTVTADAGDDFQLAGVTFAANGVDLGPEDQAAPYSALLNTDTLPAGPYTLTAVARDTAGHTTLSTVSVVVFHPDTTPPTVAITAPAPGTVLSTPVTVTADAGDDFQLAGVTFRANGVDLEGEDLTAPYSAGLNTDTLPDGVYLLTALARDTAGNTALSAAVSVTVFHPDVTPPTVAITAPSAGATIAGTVQVTADAGDDHGVVGVQFQAGGVNLGAEDVSAPYSASLDTWTLPNGPVSLTAVARDAAGNTTVSAAVTVTVDNAPPKNVVVIMVDDMRFDHMQYMPLTMAQLGSEAVVFSNAVAATPLCCPSRATLLTGRYSHNHGVLTNDSPNGGAVKFNPSSTLATWLSGAGFRTGMFGKYLNEYQKISPSIPPGWNDFQVIVEKPGSNNYVNYDINDNGTRRTYGTAPSDYSTTLFASRAVSFINATPVNQSLALFYVPFAPHAPAVPHPSDVGRYAGFPKWRPPNYNEADVSDKTSLAKLTAKFSTAQINASDALHRSMLEALQAADRGAESIILALKAQGRWNNTLLVFLSDNGLAWGENRMLDRKSCPYEACIRIPMLVRVPGIAPRTETKWVSNVDLAPTIAAWVGVSTPGNVNGLNLLPLLANPAAPWRTEVLIEQLGLAQTYKNFYAVRNDRYIYVEYLNGEKELYDLQTDPWQMTNVVTKAAYASIRASLAAILAVLKTS